MNDEVMVCSHFPIPIKMGCFELHRGVHTAQTQRSTPIPIGFCANLSASSVSVSVSVSVSDSVKTPFLWEIHQ